MKTTGFTLIELMVVMFIIGLTLALVQVNLMPSDSAQLQDEADRLMTVLGAVQDEVAASGRGMALEITDDGYRLLQHQGKIWQLLQVSPFAAHRFAEGLRWGERLFDGKPLSVGQRALWRPGAPPPELSLKLIALDQSERQLVLDPLGRLRLAEPASGAQ